MHGRMVMSLEFYCPSGDQRTSGQRREDSERRRATCGDTANHGAARSTVTRSSATERDDDGRLAAGEVVRMAGRSSGEQDVSAATHMPALRRFHLAPLEP